MPEKELASTVGYCGLVCGVCKRPCKGNGCRSGGGLKGCYQRECCIDKDIDGCWQCQDFPCDKGFFGDKAWRGLCIGCIESIKDKGIEVFVGVLISSLGEVVDYGEYRFRDPVEIKAMLLGDPVDG